MPRVQINQFDLPYPKVSTFQKTVVKRLECTFLFEWEIRLKIYNMSWVQADHGLKDQSARSDNDTTDCKDKVVRSGCIEDISYKIKNVKG